MADTPTSESRPLWEVLNLTQEQFMRYPPSWRLAQARQHQPLPSADAHPRRPTTRPLTAEELQSLEGLDRHTRLTRARQMQQSPRPDGT
jgi:hypothetical protein